jgi:hypothetical protein
MIIIQGSLGLPAGSGRFLMSCVLPVLIERLFSIGL